jgi:hypothetical protein
VPVVADVLAALPFELPLGRSACPRKSRLPSSQSHSKDSRESERETPVHVSAHEEARLAGLVSTTLHQACAFVTFVISATPLARSLDVPTSARAVSGGAVWPHRSVRLVALVLLLRSSGGRRRLDW